MTTPLRAVVVDDEPLARRRVVRLLKREPDVEVVAVCGDGREAVQAVHAHAPDLLFLDVQMPEMNGVDVIRALDPGCRPAVVFITAYDQYAIQAFEVHALDYLLKPFAPTRFQEAVQRARDQLRVARPDVARQLRDALLGPEPPSAEGEPPALEPPAGSAPLSRILVKDAGKMFFVRVADVDWIEAEGNYVRLHAGAKSHLARGRINVLEERLPPDQFARIHRSTIVNLDRIKEVYPWFGGDYVVVLHDATQLKLSRSYRGRLLVQRIE